MNKKTEQHVRKKLKNAEAVEIIKRTPEPSIKIIGVGGAGSNIIKKIKGLETIAIDTRSDDLKTSTANKKILIGKGFGTDDDPKLAEKAAKAKEEKINTALKGADIIFIAFGLGGGTGTGAAPVVAEIAKKAGALAICVCTLPFSMEGQKCYERTVEGLKKLKSSADGIMLFPNNALLEIVPDLPLRGAFKSMDDMMMNVIGTMVGLVMGPGLIKFDAHDIKSIMSHGPVAFVGIGEADSPKGAAEKALGNPLLDADISKSNAALVHIIGGADMNVEGTKEVVGKVAERLRKDARILWTAQIKHKFPKNTMRVMLIATIKDK